MRWCLALLPLSVAACSDRRDFGERYDDTANEIAARAEAIDANLAKAEAEAAANSQR